MHYFTFIQFFREEQKDIILHLWYFFFGFYFHPVKNVKDINFNKRSITNILFFLVCSSSTIKSIFIYFFFNNSKNEAQIVHNYLKELSKNPKTLSESLHFQKNKYLHYIHASHLLKILSNWWQL